MTDNTELKRLAEALISANGAYMDDECNIEKREAFHAADDSLQDALSPEVVLALIAENERLVAWREGLLKERAAHIRQRDQLKAENEALLAALKGMTSMYGFCWDLVDGGLLCMQDNVQRFEDAHEAAQKVIAAMSKGEQL